MEKLSLIMGNFINGKIKNKVETIIYYWNNIIYSDVQKFKKNVLYNIITPKFAQNFIEFNFKFKIPATSILPE